MVKRLLALGVCVVVGLMAAREVHAEVLADSQFRPQTHGFAFPNWGSGENPHGDMTADDAAYLFGEQVCARFENESCVPTPGARLWVEEMNKQAGGGHCEGLAALSAAFFINKESVQDYGGSKARDLPPSNPVVMRSITSLFATQFIEPVQSASRATREYSLQQIIDTLVKTLKATGGDYPTLGFYGAAGGHAVTPYKVERTGEGKYRIYIYDNNYPGVENHIDVDVPGDRWVYEGAALNPSEKAEPWSGGSGTMDITMTAVRYDQLVCPFCDGSGGGGSSKSGDDKRPAPDRQPASAPDELIVTTESPCREVNVTGKTSGKHMTVESNGIAGASMTSMRGSGGCLLTLPDKEEYTILLGDGATRDGNSSGLAMFAPGKVFAMDDITLHDGQDQEFTLGDDSFEFEAGGDQSPTLRIGGQGEGPDEYYEVRDFKLGEGHSFSANEGEDGRTTFSNDDPELEDFDIYTEVVDDDGTESELYEDVDVGENGQFMLAVGDDGEMDLDIDHDADGMADDVDTDDDGDGTPDSADADDDGDGEPDVSDTDDVEDGDEGDGSEADDGAEDEGDESEGDDDSEGDGDESEGDGDSEGDDSEGEGDESESDDESADDGDESEGDDASVDDGDESEADDESMDDGDESEADESEADDESGDEGESEDEGDSAEDEDFGDDDGGDSEDEDFGDDGESEDEGEDDFRS